MRNIIIASFVFLYLNISAQEVISASGDFFLQANGSISWTLGEPISETYSNSGILTQGFQQDYENILSMYELQNSSIFNVFPNPFSTEINIDFFSEGTGEYLAQIKDASGKTIYNENFFFSSSNFNNQINVSHLASGIYFLQIINLNNQETVTFKLNKIN